MATDILEEIYKNNRKLIVTDSNSELYKICEIIDKSVTKNSLEVTLKDCKLVNFLTIFLETGNRRVESSYQTILKSLYNKEQLVQIWKKAIPLPNLPHQISNIPHGSDRKIPDLGMSGNHSRSNKELNVYVGEKVDGEERKTRYLANK